MQSEMTNLSKADELNCKIEISMAEANLIKLVTKMEKIQKKVDSGFDVDWDETSDQIEELQQEIMRTLVWECYKRAQLGVGILYQEEEWENWKLSVSQLVAQGLDPTFVREVFGEGGMGMNVCLSSGEAICVRFEYLGQEKK